MFSFTQKVEVITLIVFIIFYFASADASVSMMWILGIILSGSLLMIDLMFMDDKAFYYVPDYDTWKAKTDSDY